jgi:hypothetical protein
VPGAYEFLKTFRRQVWVKNDNTLVNAFSYGTGGAEQAAKTIRPSSRSSEKIVKGINLKNGVKRPSILRTNHLGTAGLRRFRGPGRY